MLSNKPGILGMLVDAFYHFFDLMLVNVLWAVLTVPLITAPAALAGLYYATNQLAHDRPISWRTFFHGFRQYFGIGLRWVLLNFFFLSVAVSNLIFYDQFEGTWVFWVQALFIALIILWLIFQTFTFPLLLELSSRRLLVSMRNTLILLARRPGLALGVALLGVLLAYISTRYVWIFWLLITASLNAYLANRTVIQVLGEIAEIQETAE